MEQATTLFGTQVISQLHKHQHVRFRNKLISLEKYCTPYPGVRQPIRSRGDEAVSGMVSRARLYVDAHHQKRFVLALKSAQETASRDMVASDLSWRTLAIVPGYTPGYPWRWRVEGFFEDWKVHEGWGQLTTQPDEDG
jgi:hypothetical protein